jgi:hypothetical protein
MVKKGGDGERGFLGRVPMSHTSYYSLFNDAVNDCHALAT